MNTELRSVPSERSDRGTRRERSPRPTPQTVIDVASWIQSRMDADKTAAYIPFVINNIQVHLGPKYRKIPDNPIPQGIPNYAGLVRRVLTEACQIATCALNGNKYRANPRRHGPQQSVGCILLFATTGREFHLHGWVRIPLSDTQLVPFTIRNHQERQHIRVPSSLATFGDHVTKEFRTRNIWFPSSSDGVVLSDAAQDAQGLAYLLRPKLEVRLWEDTTFLPAYVFKQLTNRATEQDRATREHLSNPGPQTTSNRSIDVTHSHRPQSDQSSERVQGRDGQFDVH